MISKMTTFEIKVQKYLETELKCKVKFNTEKHYEISPEELQVNVGYKQSYTPDFVLEKNGITYLIEVKPYFLGRMVRGKIMMYDNTKNKMTFLFINNFIKNHLNYKFIGIEVKEKSILKEYLKQNNILWGEYLKMSKDEKELIKSKTQTYTFYDITDYKWKNKGKILVLHEYIK